MGGCMVALEYQLGWGEGDKGVDQRRGSDMWQHENWGGK